MLLRSDKQVKWNKIKDKISVTVTDAGIKGRSRRAKTVPACRAGLNSCPNNLGKRPDSSSKPGSRVSRSCRRKGRITNSRSVNSSRTDKSRNSNGSTVKTDSRGSLSRVSRRKSSFSPSKSRSGRTAVRKPGSRATAQRRLI